MSILSGVIIFLAGLVAGCYIGYRLVGIIAVMSLQALEIKRMKWEDGIFGYRPIRLTANLKAGDVVSVTLSEDLAEIFNGFVEAMEKADEV